MAIRAVTRQEFDRFGATRLTLNGRTRTVVEWFADDTGVLLGSVACHESDHDWSFMVLKRDIYGKFHVVHLETHCRDVDDARRLLFERMAIVLGASDAVPPGAA
jgi:hypothetical protein